MPAKKSSSRLSAVCKSVFITLAVFLLCGGFTTFAEARGHSRHRSNHAPVEYLMTYADSSDIMKLWNELVLDQASSLPSATVSPTTPSLPFDARETNTTFEIHCDLPGVEKKDISLSLKNNELTISANRKDLALEEGATFRRTERLHGDISRTIVLPENIEKDKIVAETKDGVLSIIIPKTPQEKQECDSIKIEIQ